VESWCPVVVVMGRVLAGVAPWQDFLVEEEDGGEQEAESQTQRLQRADIIR